MTVFRANLLNILVTLMTKHTDSAHQIGSASRESDPPDRRQKVTRLLRFRGGSIFICPVGVKRRTGFGLSAPEAM